MSFLISAAGIIFGFGLVIFVHEFGHFIVAKKSGVKVDRFSFGLGPEMVGFQWGETRYCIAWIPLGGEVRMAGEMELEDAADAKPKDPREFFALPWYRRIPIVVAGPAMNYVLSFVLFAAIAFVAGVPKPATEARVGDLASDFPAAQAGLLPGDLFLSMDGEPVQTWKSMAERIHVSAGKTLSLEVQRGTSTFTVHLTPREADGRGLIGITPATVHERLGFLASLANGAEQCWGWSKMTLVYLGQKIVKREKPELSGPVGIASVVAKAAKSGWADYFFLISLISVGIGLFNLFPIPMLDGGHLAFYLWEGIARRPAPKKVVQFANTAGMAVLLSIFIFATFADIKRLRAPKSEAAVSAADAPAK